MTIDSKKLLSGDKRILAKAITLVESRKEEHREDAEKLLESILPKTGNSIRIGISGIPGVGKSTFIEALGLFLTALGKKVAVLAIDPSSPISGGSILGDKTRMESLSQNENAFIRPSPTSGALGGVAHKTRETILLCEVAGYEIILLETVGVGQSEYEAASLVDFFLVLMIPNAGDELQGIKKGIIELADSLVINKADGDSAQLAKLSQVQYQGAFEIINHDAFWKPQVLTCSSLEKRGFEDIWKVVEEYISASKKSGHFVSNRSNQNLKWFHSLFHELISVHIDSNKNIQKLKVSLEKAVADGTQTPVNASKALLKSLFS